MTTACSIDRLIQITRLQWEQNHSESGSPGSATQPLTVSLHSLALCGLQSAHEFTGMGDWRDSDDNKDDTLLAAA